VQYFFAGSTALRLVGMAFGLLASIQLARGLGATGYGVYALALSVVSLISIPAEFGLPALVEREVGIAQLYEDWPRTRSVLHWAIRMVFVLAACVLLVGTACTMFGPRLSPDLLPILLVGSLLVLVVPFGNIYAGTLRGLRHMVRGDFPDVVLRPVLFSALLLPVSLLHPGGITPGWAMAMQVLAAGMALLCAALTLYRLMPPASGVEAGVGHEQERTWLRGVWPMALNDSIRVLHGNLLIVFLGVLAAPAVVGVFRVASSMGLLLMLPMAMVHVFSAPVISRLHAGDQKDALRRYLRLCTLGTVACLLVLTLPIVVYGESWLASLFGSEFAASSAPLVILSIGTLCGSAFGPGAALLTMAGHERRVTGSFGMSLVLLAGSSPPLILLLGADGAALANAIAFTAWNGAMWRDVRRLLHMDPSLAAWRHLPSAHAVGPA